MKRLMSGASIALTAASLLGGCSGDSSPTGANGTGGSAATGEGRNEWGDCPAADPGGSETCTGQDEYDQCVVEACEATFTQCLGDGYATGNYSGPCEPTIRCVLGCDCGDGPCELGCVNAAPDACLACYSDLEACLSGSGCQEPVCQTTGTGGTGANAGTGGNSGTGGDPATGGSSGTGGDPAICPYAPNALDCTAACANLAAIANTCATEETVPPEVRAMLTLAAQGTGTLCRTTCAADSPSYPEQWGCFKAVPVTEPCSAIGGCTLVNCD